MSGTFPPAAEFKGNRELATPACITARASRMCRDACQDCLPAVAEKTFPAFPAHAQPQFCVFDKRPIRHVMIEHPDETVSSLWPMTDSTGRTRYKNRKFSVCGCGSNLHVCDINTIILDEYNWKLTIPASSNVNASPIRSSVNTNIPTKCVHKKLFEPATTIK